MDKDRACDNGRSTVRKPAPAGQFYNAFIFGAILLSVLALLLEPDPGIRPAPNQCALDRSGSERLRRVFGGFRSSSGLGGVPRRYLFSFTGLIDASAVLFFFVPQVRSELLLWVFKSGRMRVFAAQVHR